MRILVFILISIILMVGAAIVYGYMRINEEQENSAKLRCEKRLMVKDMKQLEKELKMEKELSELGTKTKLDLEKKYNKLLTDASKYHQEISPLEFKIKILTEENEDLKEMNKFYRTKLVSLSKYLTKMKNDLKDCKKELEECKKKEKEGNIE